MSTCIGPECVRGIERVRARLCDAHYQQTRNRGTMIPLRGKVMDRDHEGNKRCSLCSTWQPESAYASSSGKGDGLQSRCRSCNADIYAGRRELIRDKMRAQRFGLTREGFDALLASQGGSCAICGTTDPGSSHWHTDHDHACCPSSAKTCGRCVRGLLCASCNYGIGHLRDDVSVLHSAIEYLQRAATTRGAA